MTNKHIPRYMSTYLKKIADDYLDGKIDLETFKREVDGVIGYVEDNSKND